MTTKYITIRPCHAQPPARPALPAHLACCLAVGRWLIRTARLMGCVLCVLAAMMFYGGFVEGTVSLSAMLFMWAVCFNMCRDLYLLAGGEQRYYRWLRKRALRRRRRQQLLARWFRR